MKAVFLEILVAGRASTKAWFELAHEFKNGEAGSASLECVIVADRQDRLSDSHWSRSRLMGFSSNCKPFRLHATLGTEVGTKSDLVQNTRRWRIRENPS
jgi:hypothetical protein